MLIEQEKTYLAKFLPEDLDKYPKKEIVDIYYPKEAVHAVLRLRKNGSKYELTKKTDIGDDKSQKLEQTVPLDENEYLALAHASGKKVSKVRYYYPYQGLTAEIDVFQDELSGLVEVDFEFNDIGKLKEFEIPDFCLVDVTNEDFAAGGMLCGKSYSDIEGELERVGYKKIAWGFEQKDSENRI